MLARTISAPISRRSAGVRLLTTPSVPTGMNAGVSTTPCAVWSRPRRASPSRATSSNDGTRSRHALTPSAIEHGVAVAVEAVAGGDGVGVGREHPLAAGEGRDQQEQRRARQVEVREERVDRAELVARHDGQIGPAGPGGDGAVRARGRLQRADGRRPHRDHAAGLRGAPAPPPRPSPREPRTAPPPRDARPPVPREPDGRSPDRRAASGGGSRRPAPRARRAARP